ncbi:ATS14-like protein [Mya arenaria]|uniref:ATS14-like protein n=2 Tax=Mya arenaria TaxID=6604 RepID=A0ABY7ER87_MYAAR|nr:ATS14-like protein [Mya arenaria]
MDTPVIRIAILIANVLLSNMASAEEQKCYSRFDYDEKMIEKMIRAEIKLEEFANRMDLNDATLGDIRTDFRNEIQSTKEDISMNLNDFIEKYVANTTDGGWSDWTFWNTCPVTCGISMVTRSRSCDNPTPRMFGRQCVGNHQEWKTCEVQKCPGQTEKIAFYATITAHIYPTKANTPLKFTHVVTNVGGGYDPSTGYFTAPTDGIFVFSLTVRQHGHSMHGYDGHVSIKKGDTVVMKVYLDMHSKDNVYDTASGTTVLELRKEDTVYVVADDSGKAIIGIEEFSSYFSGYRIW